MNKLGSGTTTLSGNNTYAGSTTVNAGTLLVTGSTSAVVVNNSGTLGGNGTLGAVTINSGGTIAPGNSPGTISVGNMTWNAGGNYNWQLANATASAGSGWDLISSTGTLTITANATNKFTINLWSLSGTGPDVSGIAANFDAQSNYSWNIGTFSNINGFDASYFEIVTAASNGTDGFVGGNGIFSVNSTTTTLVLNYAAAPTPTPTPTPTPRGIWNTSSGNWSQTPQWKSGLPPLANEVASFTGNGGTTVNDNYISDLSGIAFSSNSTGSYTLNGTAITLGSAGVVNNSSFDQTLAVNLTLGANQSFTAAAGNLSITGNIFTNGCTLTSDGARATSIGGIISGSGSLVKTGSGTTILAGNNTYTGGTTALEGVLAGTTQSLQGAIVNNGVVNFDQSFNGNYAGVMSGTGSLTKSGIGIVQLSGNNSYSGGTTINSGVLAASVITGNLVTLNPNAFGTGGVAINAGGAMLVPSTTLGGGRLAIGNDLTLNNGTIAFYDIGTSPEGKDLHLDVAL